MDTIVELLPPGFLQDAQRMPWLAAAFLALGLAASSGLRTFLPLLLVGVAGRWNLFGLYLGENFAWLTSDTALLALGLATVVETLADKVPLIDHFLDVVGTFFRPLAGALAAAAVWNTQDPAIAALMGLVLGAPLAFGFHSVKAGARGASTATTAGAANPVVSLVEDVAALFLGVVSFFLPFLVPLLLLLAFLLLWLVYRATRKAIRRGQGAPAP